MKYVFDYFQYLFNKLKKIIEFSIILLNFTICIISKLNELHYRLKYDEPNSRTQAFERAIFAQIDSAVSVDIELISLIIPVYQEEKIIECQLKRFPIELRKKYNFELIVSDGGSTDKTVEIAKRYADKVVVHQREYRQTISEGRNRGAEVARGNFLIFLNADSYPADIDSFFKFIRTWAAKPTSPAPLACYVSGFPDEILFKDKVFYSIHNGYVSFLNAIGLGMGRGECQIVKREVFFQVGGYNNILVAGEDFDLYRRINKIAKVKFESKLVILESPRRFRKYGYLKTLWYWTLNALTVIFCGKSVSQEWEAVR